MLGAAPARAEKFSHEVLPGETLRQIARRYHVSPSKIRRWNKLPGHALRAGRKLTIVSSAPVQVRTKGSYQVRRGDNLARIARKHEMSKKLLLRLNPKVDWRRLKHGQTVWVVRTSPAATGGRRMYQLAEGPGYVVRNKDRAWGTFLMVTRLMEVLADHARAFPGGPPVRVDDISRKGGGFLAPHRSHRGGRDVDLRYPMLDPTDRYVRVCPQTIEVERTFDLIKRFIATGDVVYVFVDYRLQKVLYERAVKARWSRERLLEVFQYPRSRRSMVGIIRHEPGHATHFHVRFRSEASQRRPNT